MYTAITNRIREIALHCGRDPASIELVAVSKSQPMPKLLELYNQGCRSFGESRLQEALPKIAALPEDCKWHFIGSLQKNKAAKTMAHFDLIHSVDSLELAESISRLCTNSQMTASLLIQVNTSGEPTKHGLSPQEWEKALNALNSLPNIRIEGLMTMAPLVEDKHVIRQCFSQLRQCRDRWQNQMANPERFLHLSMGMSQDYPIAIEEGATILRIGTALFDHKI